MRSKRWSTLDRYVYTFLSLLCLTPVCVCVCQVQEVANAYGFLPPVEVSAKTGYGVDKAFMRIAKHLFKHNSSPRDSKPPGGPKIPKPPGSSCCSIA